MRLRNCLTLALAFCTLPSAVPAAGSDSAPPLTLEWVYSRTTRDALSTPLYTWFRDGSACLLDRRSGPTDRALEKLDPETGKRSVVLSVGILRERIRSLMHGESPDWPAGLPWPDAFSPEGDRLAYLINGDLFLVEMADGAARRLTRTPGEEKCVSFSPDGRRLAYVRDNNLYVADARGGGKERALTRDGGPALLNGTLSWVYWEEIFGRNDTAFWWSPDSASIAYFQSDESMVEESVFPEYEPATPKVVRQRYPKAGGKNPVVRVGVVDVEKARTRWVSLGEPAPEYVVRVKWLPDSRQLGIQTLNRRQNRLILLLADRRTGRSVPVLSEENQTSVNVHDDLWFLEGGKKFLWTSERDGYNHIYLYDISGRLLRRLTGGPWMVRASAGLAWVHGGVCAVDENGGWVYFTANHGSPVAPKLHRVRLSGGEPERISVEEGTHQVSFNPAHTLYFDRYSNLSTPWGLYLHRADGTRLHTVTAPAQDLLAPYRVRTPEFLTVPADDGFALPATLLRPEKPEPGRKYPVILYVYGGPSAPVVWDQWDRYALLGNVLLQNGYLWMAIDNRSATSRSKVLEDTAYGRLIAEPEIADIRAGVRWLKSQSWADPDRIGVWGWSGGGTMTLQLMTHCKDFKAGIAVAAVADFRYYDSKWAESALGLPQENPEGYRRSAAANFAADLSGKLLLAHGTGDDNVHPQNAWRFAREAIKAGKLLEMMIYPLADHSLTNSGRHIYEVMLDFWKRNL